MKSQNTQTLKTDQHINQLNKKLDQLPNKLDNIQVQTHIHKSPLISSHKRSSTKYQTSQKKIIQQPNTIYQQPNTFYQQTYYITGVKQNYLLLLSDNMQILQFPMGIVNCQLKIGQPIKVKLQYDTNRVKADQIKFRSLQREIYQEYHNQE